MERSSESIAAIDAEETPNHGPAVAWHALQENSVLVLLATSLGGLSSAEAIRRLAVTGRNERSETKPVRPLRIVLRQFSTLLVWILLTAALISSWFGDWLDSIAIFAIILLKASAGLYQELKAERSIAALQRMTAPNARVWRDARLVQLPAAEVVPGDVLELKAGDLVAADARLIQVNGLQCNEAPLTGESTPVLKRITTLCVAEALTDRANMVFMGTRVSYGRGRALVVATGVETEMGQVARLAIPPK